MPAAHPGRELFFEGERLLGLGQSIAREHPFGERLKLVLGNGFLGEADRTKCGHQDASLMRTERITFISR
ncbi:hypothetical protein D3C87_1875650 [compost metagenome]